MEDTEIETAVAAILQPPWQTIAAYVREECARQDKPPPPMLEHEDRFAVRAGGGWTLRGVYDGTPHIKQTAMRPDSPETPDDPIEAARVLDAHAKRFANPLMAAPEVTLAPPVVELSEADAELGGGLYEQTDLPSDRDSQNSVALDPENAEGVAVDGDNLVQEGDGLVAVLPLDGVGDDSNLTLASDGEPFEGGEFIHEPSIADEAGVVDADFTDFGFTTDLDLAAEPAALEFGAEMLESEAEAEPPTPTQFYMGDNLDRMRSEAIGDVVRISRAKQTAIWAEAGASETEYRDLLGAVMRDTINGSYSGPTAPFERFNALQGWMNTVTAIQQAEAVKVDFLTHAVREDVEAFDPEADWPS